MRVGSLIRLKKLFTPSSACKSYRYGIVVDFVPDGDQASSGKATKSEGVAEVMVQLFDPQTQEIYTDNLGTQPFYSFYAEEFEVVKE